MSYAIKRYNGDFIWFDAVTSFSEEYGGEVTQHPIEDGSSITDFFKTSNNRFSVQAVISDADFRVALPSEIGKKGEEISATDAVKIKDSKTNPLLKLVPESVLGLLSKDTEVEVVVQGSRAMQLQSVKDNLLDMQRNGEPFTLVSYKGGVVSGKPLRSCIMTSLSFSEDTGTGEALYVSITIEQIRTVTLRRGTTPEFKAVSSLTIAAAELEKVVPGSGAGLSLPDVKVEDIEASSGVFDRESLAYKAYKGLGGTK